MDISGISGIGRIVRFSTSDGVRLCGMLFGDVHGKSCIVFVHGMGSSLFTNPSFALASARRNGIAFFSFNNRGHDSVSSLSRISGKRKTRIMGGTNFERFEESVYDIRGALDAMGRLGFRNFVLCGHSTGCQKAVYYKYRTEDRRAKALVLLGAADDYEIFRKMLGGDFGKTLLLCRRMMESGKGNRIASDKIGFSAQRLDSVIDMDRVESRIFNYEGPLKEFGGIRIPVLAVFGSMEEYAAMPVRKYLDILRSRTSSVQYSDIVIGGANHSFDGHLDELAAVVSKWTAKVLHSKAALP
ncbi:alpha/beta fold hydrolase [Candidatus Marsarchaeota archaeon]|nr:alpha/beta fold hydrolase [Candidatus Marsarchaeota archaeon]